MKKDVSTDFAFFIFQRDWETVKHTHVFLQCCLTVGFLTVCFLTVCFLTVCCLTACCLTVGFLTMCFLTVCLDAACELVKTEMPILCRGVSLSNTKAARRGSYTVKDNLS